MSGWIKLHRELLEKPIWVFSTPEQKTILITLLLMANHKECEWEFDGEKYKSSQGQFITTLSEVAKAAGKGISIQNIRTALARFEKYEFLTSKPTNKNRIITICNWESYQESESAPNKQTNKQPTSNQQATNKHNKNDKNDKNTTPPISPPKGKSTENENFTKFKKWVKENAPSVSLMQEPFKESEFLRIKEDYPLNTIQEIILEMHNWKPLLSKNKSANLTFKKWAGIRKINNTTENEKRNYIGAK